MFESIYILDPELFMMAVSPVPGMPDGDQLAALFQKRKPELAVYEAENRLLKQMDNINRNKSFFIIT